MRPNQTVVHDVDLNQTPPDQETSPTGQINIQHEQVIELNPILPPAQNQKVDGVVSSSQHAPPRKQMKAPHLHKNIHQLDLNNLTRDIVGNALEYHKYSNNKLKKTNILEKLNKSRHSRNALG